ncbi:MAG TPA: hypothetical protein VLX92_19730 [Kofleriaceae bacterium]|nr:hypothetical protein [Kofleriaceae bacterium]
MRRVPWRYGPKLEQSPTIGDPCARCGIPLAAGDFTTLVDGREVHWSCALRTARGTNTSERVTVVRRPRRS